jgi:hypothetical protein
VATVGRAEVTRSLDTKDPAAAKRLHALALAADEDNRFTMAKGVEAAMQRAGTVLEIIS